jgi:hypothetical protein
MKKLTFVLAALLVTGVAFAEKNCKKKAGGKACCKKEAGKGCSKEAGATETRMEATTEGGGHSVSYNSAAAAPKACCKKGTNASACQKKEAASASKEIAVSESK